MTTGEALARVHEAGRMGVFELTAHALERMDQRGAVHADVRHVLMTAERCHAQPNGRFKVYGGLDRDGDELVLVVTIRRFVVVVTIY